IIRRSLAPRQVAPDFHRGFGFPDVFEERDLAVIAAPAAGLEQLGQVVQPLLRKIAPACENVAAARHVESLCHKPARKEKNGRETQPNRINSTCQADSAE